MDVPNVQFAFSGGEVNVWDINRQLRPKRKNAKKDFLLGLLM
jgi:hypothetical protein